LPLVAAAVAALAAARFEPAAAAGLNYVDADEAFAMNLTPQSAINSSESDNTDNLWGFRAFGAGNTVFESGNGTALEDSPQLTQTISGLTPGTNYDVYVVYWTDGDENWAVRAGTTAGNLTLYNFTGKFGDVPIATATPGISAAGAVWDTLPPPNLTGAIFTDGPISNPTDPTDRLMLLGKAGTMAANASGQISVFIDDAPANGAPGRRTWLDGVAYVAAGTTIALSATLDSTTGALTLSNPTATPFQIKSYSITSRSGALNATQWSTITGHVDGGGNATFDADPWQVSAPTDPATTPWTTQLAETEAAATGGGTLAPNGGSLAFGNIWTKTRYQDVLLNLTLADDTLVTIAPTYAGAPIAASDFDASGQININDFQTLLNNMHTNVSTSTLAQANRSGDVNGDRQINFVDFQLFRDDYEAATGAGSFAALMAQVPEPQSLLLAAGGAALLAGRKRRARRLAAALALVLCLAASSDSQAAPLFAVDVDDRQGDAAPANPGDNTVAGFNSFTLTGTTGAASDTSRTFGSYTMTVTAVNAGGIPQGGIDDRDRATPSGTPSLAQLYDDFIFTASGVGIGGGIDLAIASGGALQPNKAYSVSIYSFDSGSTNPSQARTANWLDGNSNNMLAVATSFAGAALPTTDDQYRFTGVARTDAAGNLLLHGRSTMADTTPGLFLNGLEINELIELTLEVNTTTGAARLVNEQSVGFDMNYYEIRSASGALKPGGWTSFDDSEGSDPLGTGWDEVTNSTANILSEVRLTSMTSFAPGASTSLGAAFTPGAAQDLAFFSAAPDSPWKAGIVKYVTGGAIPGDFNHSGGVDAADLAKWKADFGPGNGSDADGDGDSDGADFLLWQRNLGAGAAVAAAAAVPEPATAVLAIAASLMAAGGLRGRRFVS
jgi:hypothetical protein